MSTTTTETPTSTTYDSFQEAYDWFNVHLFESALPQCLITLQRRKNSRGYFDHQRFAARDAVQRTDEIALNPSRFVGRTDAEILSTLAHEQCHLWQAHCGLKNPKGAYHNKEWAQQMINIGLQPSTTGEPGGALTGRRVSHWIIPGDVFERTVGDLMETGFRLVWQSPEKPPVQRTSQAKHKFTCPTCGQNAWGKQDLHVLCGDCLESDGIGVLMLGADLATSASEPAA